MFRYLRRRRRDAIRQRPFPDAWREFICQNVPYAARLSSEDQNELFAHVQVFLAEKRFEGCGGLEVTDEIRVTVAAQACVLLLHRDTDYYPKLESILIYPSTYVVPGGRTPDGMVADTPQARLGESWTHDLVVLAWDSVLAGAADIHDGHNVVLHEFAHQLDQEDGAGDGAPILPRRSMYVAWARVLGHDYDELVQETARNHRTLIDRYGATNAAEFFAVATETFFEKPVQLRNKHPNLYQQLKLYYQQDPEAMQIDSRQNSVVDRAPSSGQSGGKE